jgi:hypothetical protein
VGGNKCDKVGVRRVYVEMTGLEARLEPEEGACCVRLHPTG